MNISGHRLPNCRSRCDIDRFCCHSGFGRSGANIDRAEPAGEFIATARIRIQRKDAPQVVPAIWRRLRPTPRQRYLRQNWRLCGRSNQRQPALIRLRQSFTSGTTRAPANTSARIGKFTRVYTGDAIPRRDAHYRRGLTHEGNPNLEIAASCKIISMAQCLYRYSARRRCCSAAVRPYWCQAPQAGPRRSAHR